MKFEEIKIEFERYSSLDVITESTDNGQQTTAGHYGNEGNNDSYLYDPFL